jgi:hypothetical protein
LEFNALNLSGISIFEFRIWLYTPIYCGVHIFLPQQIVIVKMILGGIFLKISRCFLIYFGMVLAGYTHSILIDYSGVLKESSDFAAANM